MAHTRSVPVCSCLLGPPARVPLFVCEGGGASAVFSAARFRFPFESLIYTIYEYGVGAAPRGRQGQDQVRSSTPVRVDCSGGKQRNQLN